MDEPCMNDSYALDQMRRLKNFYINLTIYAVILGAAIVLWLSMGAGPCWPMWIFMGFAVASFLEACKIDQYECFKNYLPFLKDGWEEDVLKKMKSSKCRSHEFRHRRTKNDSLQEPHESSSTSGEKDALV